MNRKRNWVIAVIVTTAAGLFALQNGLAPSSGPPTVTSTAIVTDTPTSSATYEGCSFMWAYHDDPELTQKINAAVQGLDPQSGATATLFGEDCVFADGHSTFSTMETDFHIRLPVEDLNDDEALGNWMKQVMDLILQIPDEETPGNPGFVEFWFVKNDTENIVAHVPIYDYLNDASGISGAELLQMFYERPVAPVTPAPITPTPTLT